MKASVYQFQPKEILPSKRERVAKVDLEEVPELIEVDSSTDCFVTPEEVAETMAAWLELENGMEVCEPSAGTGNLIRALVSIGHPASQITFIERHRKLFQLCEAVSNSLKGENEDFLEFAEQTEKRFPRIIMNPPFARGSAKRHVDAALRILDKGNHPEARLVALVPITFKGGELIEELSRDTFAGINVSTKIVLFTM